MEAPTTEMTYESIQIDRRGSLWEKESRLDTWRLVLGKHIGIHVRRLGLAPTLACKLPQ